MAGVNGGGLLLEGNNSPLGHPDTVGLVCRRRKMREQEEGEGARRHENNEFLIQPNEA